MLEYIICAGSNMLTELAERIIKQPGFDASKQDNHGYPCLFHALTKRANTDIIALLLNHGADVN